MFKWNSEEIRALYIGFLGILYYVRITDQFKCSHRRDGQKPYSGYRWSGNRQGNFNLSNLYYVIILLKLYSYLENNC